MILTLQTLQVENLNFHYYLIVLGYAISLFNLLIYNTYVGALYLKAYNLALCCGFYFLYYVFIIDISEKLNNISFILGNIFISLNLFIPLIDSTYSNLVRSKQSMQYTSFLHLSILSNLLISIQSLFTGLIVDNYIYRISLIMNICLLVFPMIFGRFNSNQIPTNIFIPISALICLYYYFISIN
ncbi:hypothetical protein HERIO_2008 [Hepatospora eriocheir]|uniref:Uncharacterized protein n=1 Tax=Hepatospora eriocheir TaxID=1081669 RepID=A0A1X0Q8A7_9MICR|nr:hypothetical protein HERIO_2008 [Hepatospora eriocheir]